MAPKPRPNFQPYRPDLSGRARALRRNMTAPESKLWYGFLRTLPVTITRQKPLGAFIVDFYCASRQLAIEIDGDSHFSQKAVQYDVSRTQALERNGIVVIRFTNRDVMSNFDGVCSAVAQALKLNAGY